MSDEAGRLVFMEGVLVTAVRSGWWVVLDELNLAPTEVLEALNRCGGRERAEGGGGGEDWCEEAGKMLTLRSPSPTTTTTTTTTPHSDTSVPPSHTTTTTTTPHIVVCHVLYAAATCATWHASCATCHMPYALLQKELGSVPCFFVATTSSILVGV